MTAVIEVAALNAFISANAKEGTLTPIVVVPPVPPPVPPVTVGDTPALIAALKLAKSGDTISLLSARFAPLALSAASMPTGLALPVTITSADPANRAALSKMTLNGVTGLHFKNIHFAYLNAGADPTWTIAFDVKACKNIAFDSNLFTGDLGKGLDPAQNGKPIAKGLNVSGSDGVTVTNNVFHTLFRGAVFSTTKNLIVRGNEVFNMASDGFDFAAVSNVAIDGNWLHDFNVGTGSLAHADMIQFWTTGTTVPSTDIVISDNFIDAGTGSVSQSIFIRNQVVDQGKAGPEMFYRNIAIINNLIRGNHTHGITVAETDGLVVADNTILQALPSSAGSVYTPRMHIKPVNRNVRLDKNVVFEKFVYDAGKSPMPADWTNANEFIVQRDNPELPSYSPKHFADPLNMAGGKASLRVLPGSPILALGVGSNIAQ